MRGERDVEGVAERRRTEESGDPAAPRRVGLEHVDGFRFEHPPEIHRVVAILAGGDSHARRRAVAQQMQALEIVGRDGLLEPRDVGMRKCLCKGERLLPLVGAIGIHEEFGVSDRIARGANALDVSLRLAPDFHLHGAKS